MRQDSSRGDPRLFFVQLRFFLPYEVTLKRELSFIRPREEFLNALKVFPPLGKKAEMCLTENPTLSVPMQSGSSGSDLNSARKTNPMVAPLQGSVHRSNLGLDLLIRSPEKSVIGLDNYPLYVLISRFNSPERPYRSLFRPFVQP